MTARQRWSLLGCCACLSLAWWLVSVQGQQRLVPTPEPPTETAPAPRLIAPEADTPGSPFPQDPPTPVVSIRVRVPAAGAAGQDLEYRICVENESAAPAHHVIVRDPLPQHAKFIRANPEPSAKEPYLEWQLGTLEAGKCREIVLVLQPTGEGDVTNCPRVQFEHGQCVTTRLDLPRLQLRKLGPTQATLYDNLTF